MYLLHLQHDLERSPETVSGYRKDLYHFGNCLIEHNGPEITPQKIGPMDIWLYLRHLSLDHNYAPRSRIRNLASIKSFYKFLKNNDYVKKDPSANIQWPSIPQSEQPVFFTVQDFKKIIGAINTSTKTGYTHSVIIYVLFLTGLRISEALSLKLKDIDLRKKIINVTRGKGRKKRIVPINKALYPVLKDYKKELKKGKEDWLFPSKRSVTGRMTPQNVRLFIKKYCRKAGIEKAKMSPHVFRHGFATTLYMDKGVDLLRIATLLGHSNTRTTEIYAHTNEKHLRSAVDLIDL
ncbi:tyrosine-type recombinase/integrase [Desulfoscipio gibsoniae]|nr:tyrosine-type recombinase/integrase [Desulfoscipio gibsoniae]